MKYIEGMGYWENGDCDWKLVPCPKPLDYLNSDSAVRLPVGCTAPIPRMTYAVDADLRLRDEAIGADMRAKMAVDEVRRLTETMATHDRIAEDDAIRARSDVTEADRKEKAARLKLASSESGRTLERIVWVSSIVLIGAVGFAVGWDL